MIWRMIDNFLYDLNLERKHMAYRFKYNGHKYKIPMEHPLWWIITIIGLVAGAIGLWAMIVGMILIGSMFGFN